ncbi:hypothetical protein HY251_17485 [bacterium]|nr:hypothetical protein [bacterium]
MLAPAIRCRLNGSCVRRGLGPVGAGQVKKFLKSRSAFSGKLSSATIPSSRS